MSRTLRLEKTLLFAAALAAGCGRDHSRTPADGQDLAVARSQSAAVDTTARSGDVALPAGEEVDSTAAVLRRFRARVPDSVLARRGACPFECCTYREWTAESALQVVAKERERGRAAFTIGAGQRFRADSGNVWITGLMLVAVTRRVGDPPYWSFEPGDTLVVLAPVGEGYFGVWQAGRVREVEGFWEPWHQLHAARTLGEHRTEWWVHVTLPDGRTGWFEATRQTRFRGADACG